MSTSLEEILALPDDEVFAMLDALLEFCDECNDSPTSEMAKTAFPNVIPASQNPFL